MSSGFDDDFDNEMWKEMELVELKEELESLRRERDTLNEHSLAQADLLVTTALEVGALIKERDELLKALDGNWVCHQAVVNMRKERDDYREALEEISTISILLAKYPKGEKA